VSVQSIEEEDEPLKIEKNDSSNDLGDKEPTQLQHINCMIEEYINY